jgi:phosphatidate cytidylyltransferase
VSPRKTWEGAAAGLLAAVGAAALARVWFAGFLGWAAIVEVGLIVGVLGQLGDLVESLWKREAGVKDSSGLIPGHGGVLDRFDNLHFVAPVLYTHLVLVHGSAGGIGGP